MTDHMYVDTFFYQYITPVTETCIQQKSEAYYNLKCFGNTSNRETNNIPSESYIYMPFEIANKINLNLNKKTPYTL